MILFGAVDGVIFPVAADLARSIDTAWGPEIIAHSTACAARGGRG